MAIIFVALAPVLPGVAAHFGGDNGAFLAQLMMTLPGIGIIVGGPITGWVVERVGPRMVLGASLLAYALSGASGLVFDSREWLLPARWLLGVAAAGIATSTTALISSRFEGDARARILGYQNASASVVGVLSILGSGAIAEGGGWRAPFALYPVLALPLLALLLGSRSLGLVTSAAAPDAKDTARQPLPLQLWLLYGLTVLLFAAAFMTGAQAAFLLAQDGVTSPWLMSVVLGAASLGNAVGSIVFGALRARLHAAGCFTLALVLMALGIGVLGLSHTPGWSALGCGLAGFGSGVMAPWLASRLLEVAPEASRGRAVGLLYAAIFIGDFLNPVFMAALQAVWTLHSAFVVVAGLLLGGALLSLRRRPAQPASGARA
jgi:MFS family permease